MRAAGLQSLNASAVAILGVAFAITFSGITLAQDSKAAEDIELDFHFLHLGLSRKAVVNILGTPNASTESETFKISYHKLSWLGPDGKKYIASFFQDRLWRWKRCSASVTDC